MLVCFRAIERMVASHQRTIQMSYHSMKDLQASAVTCSVSSVVRVSSAMGQKILRGAEKMLQHRARPQAVRFRFHCLRKFLKPAHDARHMGDSTWVA